MTQFKKDLLVNVILFVLGGVVVLILFKDQIFPINQYQFINTATFNTDAELFHYYMQSILDTVYWTLGVSVTIVFVIITFNWFSMFRLNQRDKVTIKEDIENKLEGLLNSREKDSIATINEHINRTFISMRREIENYHSLHSNKIDALDKKIIELNVYKELDKAEVWRNKGVYMNSVSRTLDALDLVLQNNFTYTFYPEDLLNNVLDDIKNEGYLSPTQYAEICEKLDKYRNNQKALVDTIIDYAKTIRKFD